VQVCGYGVGGPGFLRRYLGAAAGEKISRRKSAIFSESFFAVVGNIRAGGIL
jgi:hypothetical protein